MEIITIKRQNITDFAKERNMLMDKSKDNWLFFVDPDEVVSEKLKKEALEATKNDEINGYFVVRRDYMFGRELKHGEFSVGGPFGNAKLIRLARKGAGRWKRKVHEYWDVRGQTATLINPLIHYPHPTINKFIANVDYFSTLHAKALKSEGKKSNLLKIIVWPPGKFIYNYVFRLGFLDGMEGFIVALTMSFHSFLSWSKLYFLRS